MPRKRNKQYQAEYRKRYYDKLRKSGTCITCRIAPSAANRKQCAGCLQAAKEHYQNTKANGICTSCEKQPTVPGKTQCDRCGQYSRGKKYHNRWYLKLRDEVYAKYGGYRCMHCGITDPDVLSIDHMDNDGAEHRRQLGNNSTYRLLTWLRDNGYPPNYQPLCRNCNWKKYRCGGVLPKQDGHHTYEDGGV